MRIRIGTRSDIADYFQTQCWCFSKYLLKCTKCSCILTDPDRIWISKFERLGSVSLLVGSGSVADLLICGSGNLCYEQVSLRKMSLRVLTFALRFWTCFRKVRERSKVTPRYFGCGQFFNFLLSKRCWVADVFFSSWPFSIFLHSIAAARLRHLLEFYRPIQQSLCLLHHCASCLTMQQALVSLACVIALT